MTLGQQIEAANQAKERKALEVVAESVGIKLLVKPTIELLDETPANSIFTVSRAENYVGVFPIRSFTVLSAAVVWAHSDECQDDAWDDLVIIETELY